MTREVFPMAAKRTTLGQLIARGRHEQDLTQFELAVMSGCSLPSIQKWEADRVTPRVDSIRKLWVIFEWPDPFPELGPIDSGDRTKARYLSPPGWGMLVGTTDLTLAHAS